MLARGVFVSGLLCLLLRVRDDRLSVMALDIILALPKISTHTNNLAVATDDLNHAEQVCLCVFMCVPRGWVRNDSACVTIMGHRTRLQESGFKSLQ